MSSILRQYQEPAKIDYQVFNTSLCTGELQALESSGSVQALVHHYKTKYYNHKCRYFMEMLNSAALISVWAIW